MGNIDRHGVYIMDAGEAIYMLIGRSVGDQFLSDVFNVKTFQELPDYSVINIIIITFTYLHYNYL
jgi:hypothetical protein